MMKNLLAIGLAAVLLALPASDGFAARAKDKIPIGAPEPFEQPEANATVKRVQRALTDAGYYNGPVDGRFNDETDKAIRKYQRRENLPENGIASEELAAHIETGAKVQSLLKQLELQRKLKMDEARKALLANPQTRDLVAPVGPSDQKAVADRDSTSCFKDPTPKCLLEEAVQSALTLGKAEFRDWVLGEILVAEAKAGLVTSALETVRLIGDPRLIMVALRDIAEAQAVAGRPVEALSAADIIPEPQKRLEALSAIATIQAERHDLAGAAETALKVLESLDQIQEPLKRLSLQAGIIVVLSKAGKSDLAHTELVKLQALAEMEAKNGHRNTALRHLANTHAETGDPVKALDVIKDVPDVAEHTPVLISAATAQAQAGQAEQALSTAGNIEAVRYRAVVLSRIALAQVKRGNLQGGLDTLKKSTDDAGSIDKPFARAYAFKQIAFTLMEISRLTGKDTFEQILDISGLISDDKLRSHTLWTLATSQRLAGKETGAKKAEEMAEQATKKIQSPFTRVWLFCEIAMEHLHENRTPEAWANFQRALAIAEKIDSAWGRSRALARLASSLIELNDGVKK